jgi:hypothetical protein
LADATPAHQLLAITVRAIEKLPDFGEDGPALEGFVQTVTMHVSITQA